MSTQQFAKGLTASLVIVMASLVGCTRGLGTGPSTQKAQASDPPTILMVAPQANGVGTNREIAVVFSKPMDPASINTGSFRVAGVTGTVTYDTVNNIGAFKASSDYAPQTTYHATITVEARDLNGTPLAQPFDFSFTTRPTSDTSPPKIVAINVAAGATGVPLDQKIRITFDEPMDSLTITPSTFFIEGVTGFVTYDAATQTATFTPVIKGGTVVNLAANTTYTITVTTEVKDMGGVPLDAAFHQTFTTGPGQGGGVPPAALCPLIGNFSVLAGSTVTNTGSTVITGDVGVSPGTAVTGFPPGLASGATHTADGAAAQAQATLTVAYNDAEGRSGATTKAGDLGGQTLTAGVYKSTSSLGITGDLTLDAQGNPDAVFIFQIASTLTTASASRIVLIGSAKPCNVFWQVGSSATLGTASIFKGNIMALTSITITTGVNLEGRALARNGAVTLDSDVITGCACP
jgi:Ice-binding-like/Bacterial Ig-like domain